MFLVSVVISLVTLILSMSKRSATLPLESWRCETCWLSGAGCIERYHYKRAAGFECAPGYNAIVRSDDHGFMDDHAEGVVEDVDDVGDGDGGVGVEVAGVTPVCIQHAYDLYDQSYGREALDSKSKEEFVMHCKRRSQNPASSDFKLNKIENLICKFSMEHVHLSRTSGEALLALLRTYFILQTKEVERINELPPLDRYEV
jgi:hypothetical protein